MRETNKKNILFVAYGGGHMKMLLPVIRRVLASAVYSVKVLALTMAAVDLKKANIEYLTFKDLSFLVDDKALEYGRKLCDPATHHQLPVDESIAYLGISFYELMQEYGEEQAHTLYADKGRHAFLPVQFMQKVLGYLKIDLVVATNSPRAERAAILAAGRLDIPSICLIDLLGKNESQWIAQKGYASKLCVLNSYVQQLYLNYGRNLHEVIVTGNPSFDTLSEESANNKGNRLRGEMGWKDRPVILWAEPPQEPAYHPFTGEKTKYPDLVENVRQTFLLLANSNPNWIVVIRPHPSQMGKIENLLANVIVSKEFDLHDVLVAADVVITTVSTIGFEAVVMKKPLVTINSSVYYEDLPYDKLGYSIGVDNLDDLESCLHRALDSTVKEEIDLCDGGAAKRVVNEIEMLLNKMNISSQAITNTKD